MITRCTKIASFILLFAAASCSENYTVDLNGDIGLEKDTITYQAGVVEGMLERSDTLCKGKSISFSSMKTNYKTKDEVNLKLLNYGEEQVLIQPKYAGKEPPIHPEIPCMIRVNKSRNVNYVFIQFRGVEQTIVKPKKEMTITLKGLENGVYMAGVCYNPNGVWGGSGYFFSNKFVVEN